MNKSFQLQLEQLQQQAWLMLLMPNLDLFYLLQLQSFIENNYNHELFLSLQIHSYWKPEQPSCNKGVGKSSIVMQFIDSTFRSDCDPTIGVQFASKTITVGTQLIKMQIWDTAGQEAFQSITRSYYRGTIGAIVVYDVTSRKSFQDINKWLEQTRNYSTNDNVVVMLVANKTDMKQDRQVTKQEGEQYANTNGLLFTECSAKLNQNVKKIFQNLCQQILKRIKHGQIDISDQNGGVKLGEYMKKVEAQPQKKCC